jgi:hypothetical protein
MQDLQDASVGAGFFVPLRSEAPAVGEPSLEKRHQVSRVPPGLTATKDAEKWVCGPHTCGEAALPDQSTFPQARNPIRALLLMRRRRGLCSATVLSPTSIMSND